MWKSFFVVTLLFFSTTHADEFSMNLEDRAIAEIDRLYSSGDISLREAEELYDYAVETKGAGFYIEIDGVTYTISFTSAWRCAKSLARTLGCVVSTRSIACLASDDSVEIVQHCRLRRAN